MGTSPRNCAPALDWTNKLRMENRRRAGSTLRIREVRCSNLTPKNEYPEALRGCIRYLHANSGTVLSMCTFRFCQRRHIRRDVYFFIVGLNVALLVRMAHVLHRMAHVLHRMAHVPHRMAHVPHRMAHVPHRMAHVLHRMAHVLHRMAHVLHRIAHVPHRMSLNKGEIKVNVSPNNRRHLESILCTANINTLNPELNPICYLLALLGAHHFLHVSRIRVKLLTFRLLMSYIYIWSAYT